jgi:hypothetical protein
MALGGSSVDERILILAISFSQEKSRNENEKMINAIHIRLV